MNLLFSMPGGSEWLVLALFFLSALVLPITVVVLFIKNRKLQHKINLLTDENNELIARLLSNKHL